MSEVWITLIKEEECQNIKPLKAEVAFLQETHIRKSDNSLLMGEHFHSEFQAEARIVLILNI